MFLTVPDILNILIFSLHAKFRRHSQHSSFLSSLLSSMTSSTSRRSLHILKRFTFLESLEQMLVLGDESGVCELESFFGRSLHEVK